MKSYEYFRGAFHGYKSAMETRAKYGFARCSFNARDLEANLRKRSEDHTDFDRGYSHAYSVVAAKLTLEECDIVPFQGAKCSHGGCDGRIAMLVCDTCRSY